MSILIYSDENHVRTYRRHGGGWGKYGYHHYNVTTLSYRRLLRWMADNIDLLLSVTPEGSSVCFEYNL